jgi:hypothetical protein
MHIAAARLNDTKAIVDHKLYWAAVSSEAEARYLCAILNSAIVTVKVRPLMSYGKDERDIDKHVWKLAIPTFDPGNQAHLELALMAERSEAAVGKLALDSEEHFSASRRKIREFLQASQTGQRIEELVSLLLEPEASGWPPGNAKAASYDMPVNMQEVAENGTEPPKK